MPEIWKPVIGFEDYEVSNKGRMRSWKPYRNFAPKPTAPRIMNFGTDKDGYYKVTLFNSSGRKEFRMHILVLKSFLPCVYTQGLMGLHKNGINTDNRLSNLYWGDAKQNSLDAKRHGTYTHGRKVNTCVLTEEQVKYARLRREPAKLLATKFGCTIWNIYQIWSGNTWKHLK